MTKQEQKYEMIKRHLTDFILNNLPVEDSELDSCWDDFIEELKENDFYGEYCFYDKDKGCCLDFITDEKITAQTKDAAFENTLSILQSCISKDMLKEINNSIKKLDLKSMSVFYLEPDFCIKYKDVSLEFHYPSERFLFLSDKDNEVTIFNFSASNESLGVHEFDECLDFCTHYVIQRLCDGDIYSELKSLYIQVEAMHLVVDEKDTNKNKIENHILGFDLSTPSCIILKNIREDLENKLSDFSSFVLSHFAQKKKSVTD